MTEEKQAKKEMTLDDLARMMTDGFANAEKSTDKKIESLATMVAKGFDELEEKMDAGFKEVRGEIKEVKIDTENIKAEIIKKVDKFEHNDLTYRVEKLEKNFA